MVVWTTLLPAMGAAMLALTMALPMGGVFTLASALALIGAVVAGVHHAEVVAHRVGEPFGTLVLAVAITVMEVALIMSLMLAGGLSHHEQSFRLDGTNSALAALVALAGLSLVLPPSPPVRR